MSKLPLYEVEVRLRLRLIAADEDEATRIVAEEITGPIGETIDGLHETNVRLAAWRLHADDVVEEIDT